MIRDEEGKRGEKTWSWPMVLVVLGMVGGAVFWLTGEVEPAGEMRTEVYVWQRVWDEGVVAAVAERAGAFDAVRVSAAELSLGETVRSGVDYGVLAAGGRPVWLVVRMGSEFGGRLGDAGVLERVEEELREVLARAEGCVVAGVEFDYDCATARLGEYAGFVREMRGRFGELGWSVTALPSWMEDGSGFERLVRAGGRYVLQVHSLELPEKGERDVVFCDPGVARVAVAKAGRIGVPFMVALPTYSSVVVFGEDGGVVDVVSEDAAKAGGEALLVRSDPEAMADLVAGWAVKRPRSLRGVIWFRLPVESDARNWRWDTLEAVMAGQAPAAEMSGGLEVGADGVVKVVVENAGVGELLVPEAVVVTWSAGELVASDGLGGFREVPGDGRLVFRGGPGGVLRAGEKVLVGWMRGLELDGVEVSFEP